MPKPIGPRAKSPDGYNYHHFNLAEIFDPDDDGPAKPATEAPDFTLSDLEGGTVRLSDLRGQPVFIEFGAIT